jgi:hypothetical protein
MLAASPQVNALAVPRFGVYSGLLALLGGDRRGRVGEWVDAARRKYESNMNAFDEPEHRDCGAAGCVPADWLSG